ncbi:recombination protein NinB [Schauerella aestuarii]|uniref:recombination protein NinB n=1 Tax=Schauerella aestuarii TaxID=2511204 RepID=UPI00136C42E9|nr:recombination protein NinB [Achromobacter aestuarii]MYZ41399.1 recombination protein NinB [Achromobacter aestuarii]
MNQIFVLSHPQARQNAAQAVLQAEPGYRVEIKPRTRSSDQNARLHAIFGEIAKQAKWMGRTLTPTQWKTLMISGHAAATGHGADMVPGLEGEFVSIRESSAQMSVARMTSLIEYVQAWCVDNNVEVSQ